MASDDYNYHYSKLLFNYYYTKRVEVNSGFNKMLCGARLAMLRACVETEKKVQGLN